MADLIHKRGTVEQVIARIEKGNGDINIHSYYTGACWSIGYPLYYTGGGCPLGMQLCVCILFPYVAECTRVYYASKQ